MIANKIVRKMQIFFSDVNFLSWTEHANTNLPNRRFLHNYFFVSKYTSILHTLLHSQSHALRLHI